ncbi:hypothetical protein ACIBI9_18430 [Nonomuraea sp. NPDC050451]|uniref:hypothetical protein n=1 Tax=Nonomuraea sp. NPDC050451 TaxID=3364364 RepID=UPI0037A818E9
MPGSQKRERQGAGTGLFSQGHKAAHRVRATRPAVGVVVLSQYSDGLSHRRVAAVLFHLGPG